MYVTNTFRDVNLKKKKNIATQTSRLLANQIQIYLNHIAIWSGNICLLQQAAHFFPEKIQ